MSFAVQIMAPAAHATPSQVAWLGDLSTTHTTNSISNPDGGVTVSNCSTATPGVQAKTFSPSGVETRTLAASSFASTCPDKSAVGADGTLYTVVSNGQLWPALAVKLAAYQGNQQIWAIDPPTSCSSGYTGIYNVTVGVDGKVYMLVFDSCARQYRLVGVDPALGSITTNKLLPGGSFNTSGLMAAYNGGLVANYDNNIRYFDYAGNPGQVYPVSSYAAFRNNITATLDGRVFKPVRAADTATVNCASTTRSMVIDHIDTYTPGEAGWSMPLDSCSVVVSINPSPSGGMVIVTRVSQPGTDEQVHVISVAADGSLMWDKALSVSEDISVFGILMSRNFNAAGTDAWVDVYGNIIVYRHYGLYSSGSSTPHLQLQVLLAGSGDIGSNLYTDQVFGQNTGYSDNGVQPAIAQDKAYLALSQCAPYCSPNPSLYAFNMAGIGMDYPRGAILQPSNKRTGYVAMGDSYSSGEGVPPFIAPSDVDGCHRSTGAYPQLLATDPSFTITLQAFVACSGAKSIDMANGMNGEVSQLNALKAKPDVVTITVGGDDIGFADFAKACVTSSCTGSAHDTAIGNIQNILPGALDTFFANIKAVRASVGSNARILVLDYPMMIPALGVAIDFPKCWLYFPDDTQRAAARDVVNQLNQGIQAAVVRAGAPFEFLDVSTSTSVFYGHELCTNASYFNGLSLPINYSFHPNALGQRAYEQMVSNYLKPR